VLLAHEQGPYSLAVRAKATARAKFGYVVFSVALYGKGIGPEDAADVAARLGLTGKNRALVRGRMEATWTASSRLAMSI
jgi:hypothetical protein